MLNAVFPWNDREGLFGSFNILLDLPHVVLELLNPLLLVLLDRAAALGAAPFELVMLAASFGIWDLVGAYAMVPVLVGRWIPVDGLGQGYR